MVSVEVCQTFLDVLDVYRHWRFRFLVRCVQIVLVLVILSVRHAKDIVFTLVFLLHTSDQREVELLSRELLVVSQHTLQEVQVVGFAAISLNRN